MKRAHPYAIHVQKYLSLNYQIVQWPDLVVLEVDVAGSELMYNTLCHIFKAPDYCIPQVLSTSSTVSLSTLSIQFCRKFESLKYLQSHLR
jgi:hypothetical protein